MNIKINAWQLVASLVALSGLFIASLRYFVSKPIDELKVIIERIRETEMSKDVCEQKTKTCELRFEVTERDIKMLQQKEALKL